MPADTLNYIQKLHDEFETSMSDDLHTSVALAAISEPLKVMNDLLHTRKVNLMMNSWRYCLLVFRLHCTTFVQMVTIFMEMVRLI